MGSDGSNYVNRLNRYCLILAAALMLQLMFSSQLWADPEIIASGLFKNKAMLTIDGNTRLLKAGETSPEGVLLVSSDSKQAVIKVAGKQMTLQLSQRISASFTAAEFVDVKLLRAANGHFFASGAINGRPAKFVIDTGASAIAMNLNDARRLGIDISKSPVSTASTAGGIVETYVVNLDKVSVGAITVHNIAATVVDGDFPAQILLGNTFLSRVEMREEAGIMVLRKKF
ncbi:MAG: TIGR02281 family clan AA aspartic protease [Gammaproteobacteria bacterium]|nr:MAG: TIGR02281 family clan AA aspartic protease [Gammaproteobacteria bacterium]RLA40815.1 MAG: TIGR02281 family clan AA aspartic protease [Gammaproteobacteria bacterium]